MIGDGAVGKTALLVIPSLLLLITSTDHTYRPMPTGRVNVSQNEFTDSAPAYFNVFFLILEWVRFLQFLDFDNFYGGKWVFKIPILQ